MTRKQHKEIMKKRNFDKFPKEWLRDPIIPANQNNGNKRRDNWRPPSQSESTPIIFNTVLTHLSSQASNYINQNQLFI